MDNTQLKIGDLITLYSTDTGDPIYGVVVDINFYGITATVNCGTSSNTMYIHSGKDVSIISLRNIPEPYRRRLYENSHAFRQEVNRIEEPLKFQCSFNRFRDLGI